MFTILPDKLFLSAVGAAEDRTLLEQHRITHILNLTGPPPGSTTPRHPNAFPDSFEYLHICRRDDEATSIDEYVDRGHTFIRSALSASPSEHRVLVHCEAGISRSAITVLTYLVRFENMTLLEAYEYVKAIKPNIGPNSSFMQQAIDREREWRPTLTAPSLNLIDYQVDQIQRGPLAGFPLSRERIADELRRQQGDIQRVQNALLDEVLG